MALLPILEFPDPRLRTVAKPVTEVNDQTRKIIDDMFETMYHAPGIGLCLGPTKYAGNALWINPNRIKLDSVLHQDELQTHRHPGPMHVAAFVRLRLSPCL